MITRERLAKSEYGRGLLVFINGLTLYKVTDWGNNNSDDAAGSGTREPTGRIEDANVVTSRDSLDSRHAVVLDIDHPAWLVPSTTPGHYHLYIDVPGGIAASEYSDLLALLAKVGVIEPGYAGASIARGFTSVRLPWIKKGQST